MFEQILEMKGELRALKRQIFRGAGGLHIYVYVHVYI